MKNLKPIAPLILILFLVALFTLQSCNKTGLFPNIKTNQGLSKLNDTTKKSSDTTKSSKDSVNKTTDTLKKYTVIPLTNEVITISPTYSHSQNPDTALLIFTATTKNSYCISSIFNCSIGIDSIGTYEFNFHNVLQLPSCIGNDPLRKKSSPLNLMGIENKNIPVVATLNGKKYNGNIIITPTSISFNWNYNDGVLFITTPIARN